MSQNYEFIDKEKKYWGAIFKYDKNFNNDVKKILTLEELKYWHSLPHLESKNKYSQTRYELKKVIADILYNPGHKISLSQILFSTIKEGKPVLSNKSHDVDLDFNLSHSDDFFVAVFSKQGQVGVDIQKIKPIKNINKIAERIFSKDEVLYLKKIEDNNKQQEVFARLWSAREAIVKTIGGSIIKDGPKIKIDPQSFQINKCSVDETMEKQWRLDFLSSPPGYVCAVSFLSNK
ncbi:MAG: 4'-phosphopantetheinyl transferase family protein [Pseudobdellovibrionaceae bacterium]